MFQVVGLDLAAGLVVVDSAEEDCHIEWHDVRMKKYTKTYKYIYMYIQDISTSKHIKQMDHYSI